MLSRPIAGNVMFLHSAGTHGDPSPRLPALQHWQAINREAGRAIQTTGHRAPGQLTPDHTDSFYYRQKAG